uniref:N-acetylgalactosaminide beta-1,3-galactosyltransferase n=1 Tax=Syphacia muris TaxID=451379 RepID=A0A0N5AUB9_9BILA
MTQRSDYLWISPGLITYFKHNQKSIKLLCWITTYPSNYEKALAVKNTWCRRCIFVSSANNTELPTVNLNVTETRKNLWWKTKAALTYVYDNYYRDYDWFLKADDDTYVIVENLRSFLSQQTLLEPTYFGAKFKMMVRQGFMSGGAGYVMPKEVLKKIVTEGLQVIRKLSWINEGKDLCSSKNEGDEDVEVGLCMEKVGVKAGDSRDSLNRHRFSWLFFTYY